MPGVRIVSVMMMRAMVFDEPGAPLRRERRPAGVPGPGEVGICVTACVRGEENLCPAAQFTGAAVLVP